MCTRVSHTYTRCTSAYVCTHIHTCACVYSSLYERIHAHAWETIDAKEAGKWDMTCSCACCASAFEWAVLVCCAAVVCMCAACLRVVSCRVVSCRVVSCAASLAPYLPYLITQPAHAVLDRLLGGIPDVRHMHATHTHAHAHAHISDGGTCTCACTLVSYVHVHFAYAHAHAHAHSITNYASMSICRYKVCMSCSVCVCTWLLMQDDVSCHGITRHAMSCVCAYV